jgi:vacuolar iron transporter family protein
MVLDAATRKIVLGFQKNEITENHIYKKLSQLSKDKHNREVLLQISGDELRHYHIWKGYSGIDVKMDRAKYWFYLVISYIFGVTFGIKLMEGGEKGAQVVYDNISNVIPDALKIRDDETMHEHALVAMIDEEKLKYIGSVVLGLNDAIVEITGTLAGLTFAIKNAKIIGMAGLITGIAAALSMAASEYLSTKTEANGKSPVKSAVYTLIAYAFAVLFLILPYMFLPQYITCLALTLLAAMIMIFIFTFYYSVVREISFRSRFLEMFSISMGVAVLSFFIGELANKLLNGGRPL